VTFFLAVFFVGVFFLLAGVIIFSCQLIVGALARRKQVEPFEYTQAVPDFSSSPRMICTSFGASVPMRTWLTWSNGFVQPSQG
jgi:hypothetical protein